MLKTCPVRKSGGKGNFGMFIERDPKICAAGLPSAQSEEHMANYLRHYLLQEEADALISDAIIPDPKPQTLPSFRHPPKPDLRNAAYFSEIRELVNPENKTKFQVLADDLKCTPYKSYWKQAVGAVPDPIPMLPKGFDIPRYTFGKKTEFHGRLYNIVMPIEPLPDVDLPRRVGYQTDRNYCNPPYKPDIYFGKNTHQDPQGRAMKCCLTNDNILLGNASAKAITSRQADFADVHQARLGVAVAPNDNISSVPKGFAFGHAEPLSFAGKEVQQCLTMCEMNPDKQFFKECLGHLNTVRKVLSNRLTRPDYKFILLNLKNLDKSKTGWLSKKVLYDFCEAKLIRFDALLIEPLLAKWRSFDGTNIQYELFINILNHRNTLPDIPKIRDIASECLDYRTTYSEMFKPNRKVDNRFRAGVPSGRYIDLPYPITPDNYCKADRFHLPEETDMKACLNPSSLAVLGVSHRDVYTSREPEVVRRVFAAAGEIFSDETFNAIWNEAKTYHSQGLVCYETFRRAIAVVTAPARKLAEGAGMHKETSEHK